MLGAALKAHRQDMIIATMCGIRSGPALCQSGLSARHIHASVDASLKRLGTDWIDLFIAHRTDPLTPLEETLGALDAVVRAGKVRYIGYSNLPAWRTATAIEMQRANGWARFTHGQMHYSAMIRDVERDTIPMMAHHGLGITVWSPLAFGFLTGRTTADNLASSEHRFTDQIFEFDRDQGFALVEMLRGIAAAHNALPSLRLRWPGYSRGPQCRASSLALPKSSNWMTILRRLKWRFLATTSQRSMQRWRPFQRILTGLSQNSPIDS